MHRSVVVPQQIAYLLEPLPGRHLPVNPALALHANLHRREQGELEQSGHNFGFLLVREAFQNRVDKLADIFKVLHQAVHHVLQPDKLLFVRQHAVVEFVEKVNDTVRTLFQDAFLQVVSYKDPFRVGVLVEPDERLFGKVKGTNDRPWSTRHPPAPFRVANVKVDVRSALGGVYYGCVCEKEIDGDDENGKK